MKKLLIAVILPLLHEIAAVDLKLNNVNNDTRHTGNLGDPLNIKCEIVNNTQDETLIWYRGTRQVDIKDENSVNVSNVCIPNLTIEDNGASFTCLLKRNTTIKRSLQLNVLFPPVLSGDTQINAEEGKTVHITCGFKANPAATMYWLQNGTVITLPDNFKQDMTTDTLKISIEKVTKKHSANYTCVALLSDGSNTTRVFELIVGDRIVGLPVEAIAAAVVVGALIIAFGIFARRENILKVCKKRRVETAM